MPAYAEQRRTLRPHDRAYALAAVAAVQLALGLVLLNGLRVQIAQPPEVVERLVNLAPARPPVPPPLPPVPRQHKRPHSASAAPKSEPAPLGGSPGTVRAHAPPSVAPVIAVQPTIPPSGGGVGAGPAVGLGSGGGAGGQGYGDSGNGGTDLEQIAGEITPRDYPRHLGRAGIGGRVGVLFTVGVNGRVTRCTVTRSSGVPELDALTCRLIQQRFRYRPGTDGHGRPVPDDVEGEHIWEAGGGY